MAVFEQTNSDPYAAIYNPSFVRRVYRKRRESARKTTRRQIIEDKAETGNTLRALFSAHDRRFEEKCERYRVLSVTAIEAAKAQTCLIGETRAQRMMLCIAAHHNVTVKELKSNRRPDYLVNARNDLILALKENLDWSLPRIGRFINRDHTSVLHALRKIGWTGNVQRPKSPDWDNIEFGAWAEEIAERHG